jgi:uncharacterized protein (TIGR02466 family)
MSTLHNQSLRIARAFATPLGAYVIPDASTINPLLRDLVRLAEQGAESAGRSNVGGFRSHHDFLSGTEPTLVALREHILHAVLEMMRPSLGPEGFDGHLTLSGWANVLRRGNYNTPHNHPESAWSGVYYVDVGDAPDAASLSGLLEFLDPRPQVEMAGSPGRPFGAPIRVKPEPGLIVVFPSWLHHFVHPYTGERPRISIAFNATTRTADAPSRRPEQVPEQSG